MLKSRKLQHLIWWDSQSLWNILFTKSLKSTNELIFFNIDKIFLIMSEFLAQESSFDKLGMTFKKPEMTLKFLLPSQSRPELVEG